MGGLKSFRFYLLGANQLITFMARGKKITSSLFCSLIFIILLFDLYYSFGVLDSLIHM